MKIEYNPIKFYLEISDEDVASWRNGVDVFWKLPKDGNGKERERPEWNIYSCEGFDDNDQALHKLDDLAHSYEVNKTPKEIEFVLANAKQISNLYQKYMKHALAVCLDPDNKII